MSDIFTPIDIYCERTSSDAFAEPLNALTNLAFLLAAYLLHRHAKTYKDASIAHYWLITLIALIGIGSGLFHVFANRLTMLMDVIPIMLFLLSYIVIFARHVWTLPSYKIALCIAAFLLLSIAAASLPPSMQLNGTISYAPALLFLVIMAISAAKLKLPRTSAYLRNAAILLVVSMSARSIDMLLCNSWPHGTHFIWHLANGAVLYFATIALIYAKQDRAIK